MATFPTDTIKAKLVAKYPTHASRFEFDLLTLDWWPAVGTGAMPALATKAMDTKITALLTTGSQPVTGSPHERWARYWTWVTL